MNRLGQFGFDLTSIGAGVASAASAVTESATKAVAHVTECQAEIAQIDTLKKHRIMAGVAGAVLGLAVGYFAGKSA